MPQKSGYEFAVSNAVIGIPTTEAKPVETHFDWSPNSLYFCKTNKPHDLSGLVGISVHFSCSRHWQGSHHQS